MMIFLSLLWILCGVLTCFIAYKAGPGEITVFDCLAFVLCIVVGPIALFIMVPVIFGDTVIYRKKKD